MDFTTIVDFDGRKFTMHLVNDTDGKRARPIDSISKTIWKTKAFYSQNELRRSLDLGWVHKDSVVLDCGANIGNHSVFWGAHCKEVHAFEPFPEAFKILKQNVAATSWLNRGSKDSGLHYCWRRLCRVCTGAPYYKGAWCVGSSFRGGLV